MNYVMSGLFLVAILSTAFHCNCENSKDFKMIFGLADGRVLVANSYLFNKTKQIARFPNEISSLAVHKDYLYVSQKVHSFINRDSSIWRCKIIDSKNFIIHPNCIRFTEVCLLGESVLSMVALQDYIYVGRSDGVIWRCATDNTNNCEIFNQVGAHKITGIDYNPRNGNIYVSLWTGTLLRCRHYCGSSCESVYSWSEHKFTALKMAFDAVWIGTDTGELWKCPLSYSEEMKCLLWDKSHVGVNILSIEATNEYVYANLKGLKMWQCDPNKVWSCHVTFSTPEGFHPFIIV